MSATCVMKTHHQGLCEVTNGISLQKLSNDPPKLSQHDENDILHVMFEKRSFDHFLTIPKWVQPGASQRMNQATGQRIYYYAKKSEHFSVILQGHHHMPSVNKQVFVEGNHIKLKFNITCSFLAQFMLTNWLTNWMKLWSMQNYLRDTVAHGYKWYDRIATSRRARCTAHYSFKRL